MDEAEEASAKKKRVSLLRQAAFTVEASEDYTRRMCFLGESQGSERAKTMLSCKICGKKFHKNCVKSWAQHRGDSNKFVFCKSCDAAYHCESS
ncbi:unnamed protein product [Eruca vesicaria subsp. sativa]|uniref:Uncharacterized protein n=1 Tax=Eruca vesicaria subsp. sativa TaxID=29727 RepID=A0ABC8JUC6_ERUVS|nr:unnamed protein product [Eruca vesicaria subsp. sativa]